MEALAFSVTQAGKVLVDHQRVSTSGPLSFPARIEIKPNGRSGVVRVEVAGLNASGARVASGAVDLDLTSPRAVAVALTTSGSADAGCLQNLVANGTFDADVFGWKALGGAVVRHVPEGALEFCSPSGVAVSVEATMAVATQPPDAGRVRISARFRVADAGMAAADPLLVEYATGGGPAVGDSAPVLDSPVDGTWRRLETTYRFKGTTGLLRAEIYLWDGAPACVQLDDVCVERGGP